MTLHRRHAISILLAVSAAAIAVAVPPANGALRGSAPTNWGQPIFTDNFTGTKLNQTAWSIYNQPHPTGTKPRRTKSSVQVSHGFLNLIGHFQKPYGYVSGGISFNANQQYGRWVVRFRADAGSGYEPSVLLWPQAAPAVNGEIDLAEITSPQRKGASEKVRVGSSQPAKHQIQKTDFTKWHTLAVGWLPDRITFWLDGKLQWTVNRGGGSSNLIPDSPFHLALQNDQGCNTGCRPNKKTPKRVVMQVDWVKIYSAPGSQPVHDLADSGSKGVRAIAYSDDGKELATADGNGRTYVWTLPGFKSRQILTDPASKGANAVAFSPDSKTLAIGDGNGHVYLSQPSGFRQLNSSGLKNITSISISAQGTDVAAGDTSGHVIVWKTSSGNSVATLTDPDSKGIRAIAYSPDGTLLATGDANGHAYIWTLPNYRLKRIIADPGSKGINAVAFSTRSHFVAVADGNGSAYV